MINRYENRRFYSEDEKKIFCCYNLDFENVVSIFKGNFITYRIFPTAGKIVLKMLNVNV